MPPLFDVNRFLDTFSASENDAENIFSSRRRAWHEENKAVPRCDFAPDRYSIAAFGFKVFSLWRRSIYGRTLTEIKDDRDMRPFFAESLAPFIRSLLGNNLADGGWAIITPPPRRHKEDNFAQGVASTLAGRLSIPFFPDVAEAKNRMRIGAEFSLLNLPKQPNLILFDDIVTTGSTFMSMHRLLSQYRKNIVFVAAIRNKA